MSDQTRERSGERDYHGRFIKGSAAARKAGSKGGLITPGQFKPGTERPREAGRKGGRKSGRWSLKRDAPEEVARSNERPIFVA
jgi:general stress protein YciG